jgi:protein SOK2
MINGTKLLKVAGMTSWRSDTMLKSEQMKHIVKIGSMHLKGVWYAKEHLREISYN